jgi:hypothetical protein
VILEDDASPARLKQITPRNHGSLFDEPDAVKGQEFFVKGSADRPRGVVRWTIFDLLMITSRSLQSTFFTDRGEISTFLPGHQFFVSTKEVTNPPIGILDEEVLGMTDLAVAGMDVTLGDPLDAAQMHVVAVSLGIGNCILAPPIPPM